MSLEFFDGTCFKGLLVDLKGRIRRHDVAPSLEFECPVKRADLDFTADGLGSLAPFEFNGLDAVFFQYIFRHSQACVFHIHLDQHLPKTLMVSFVGLDPAIHFRGFLDHVVAVQLEIGVDAADIFTAHDSDAGDRAADGKGIPVFAGDFRGAQCPGKNRQFHLDFLVPAVGRFRVHLGEDGRIGRTVNHPESSGSHGIPLDIQMRVVHRIVLVRSGGDIPER